VFNHPAKYESLGIIIPNMAGNEKDWNGFAIKLPMQEGPADSGMVFICDYHYYYYYCYYYYCYYIIIIVISIISIIIIVKLYLYIYICIVFKNELAISDHKLGYCYHHKLPIQSTNFL
jgi:hypothetical protein